MQRRSFLRVSAGSLLAATPMLSACQQSVGGSSAKAQQLDAFGLQLSTVTSLMLADFEGTLASVADVGYRQVEFSAMGFLGRPTASVRKLLSELDLQAPVGRVSPKLPDNFFKLPRDEAMKAYAKRGGPEYFLDNVSHSLAIAQEMEQRYLILPALMPDQFQTLDQVKRNIDLINQAGDLCAERGVVFGYHNHNWELAPLEGVVPYDLMLEQTDPDRVTFQLDAYWIVKGGGSLEDYLNRYAGRFVTCHMKDIDAAGDFADVGSGLIDFPAFTRQAVAQGAKYFFVERDNPDAPAESIRRSYAYLKTMTF